MKGFTLIELLVVFGILVVVAVFSVPFIQTFQVTSDIYTHSDSIVKTLRKAQQQAIAGQNSSDWGVYFDSLNNKFILFKGDDYATRDAEFDQETEYAQSFNISTNFGDEVYFSLYSGESSTVGTTTVTSFNVSEVKNIVIKSSGVIQIND